MQKRSWTLLASMMLLLIMLMVFAAVPAAADINSTITPGVGSATWCIFSGNNLTCNRPPSTVAGHLLLFCEYDASAGMVSGPSGFRRASQLSANQGRSTCYYKIAGLREPASYTITFAFPPAGSDGVLMDIANAGSTPISGTPGGHISRRYASPYPAPAATRVAHLALNIVCGANRNNQTINLPNVTIVATSGYQNFTTCWTYTGKPTDAMITASTINTANYSFGWQIGIAPLQVRTGTNIATPAPLNQPSGFASNVATNTPPYSSAANPITGYGVNGCFNPVAYGADPSGSVDSSSALNAVVAPACAAQGKICIPPGTYLLQSQPWLIQCSSGRLLVDTEGAGRNSTIFENQLARANSRGGGPAIEVASDLVATDVGGFANTISRALIGAGNSWNTNGHNEIFSLNYPLNSLQPLNGEPALSVEACFSTLTNKQTQTISASDGTATPVKVGCTFAGAPLPGGNPSYTCKGAYWLGLDGNSGKLYASMKTGGRWSGLIHSRSAVGTNTTVCALLSYDGSQVRLYHAAPNATYTEDAKVAASGPVTERQDEDLTLLMESPYWHLELPQYPFKGQIDTFRISKIARCTSDNRGHGGSGATCFAPHAKLNCDSNTIFGENWTNVSKLPLVGPECTNGIANAPGPTTQAWMVMDDEVAGNPGSNFPQIGKFSVIGGAVGIHINTCAPHLSDLAMGTTAGATTWGYLATHNNSYGIIGRNLIGNGTVPAVLNNGLDYLYGLNLTCGFTCGEFSGPELSGLSILTSNRVQWGIVLDAWAHLDSFYDDAESGGNYPAILVSNLVSPTGPTLSLNNAVLIPQGRASPVQLDGATNTTDIVNSILFMPASGPAVDGTNATGNNYIVFENDFVGSTPCPPSANSFTNHGVSYSVVGGCTIKQSTLKGTTAGAAISSEPTISSVRKKMRIYLNGYENTTTTAQTIAIPVRFATVIGSVGTLSGTCTGLTATTSTVTLPASMSAAQTGLCEFDGY